MSSQFIGGEKNKMRPYCCSVYLNVHGDTLEAINGLIKCLHEAECLITFQSFFLKGSQIFGSFLP